MSLKGEQAQESVFHTRIFASRLACTKYCRVRLGLSLSLTHTHTHNLLYYQRNVPIGTAKKGVN